MSLIMWSVSTPRMANFVLFSTRDKPNSSERLKTKVAWPRSPQSHNEKDAEGEHVDGIAMANCVRELHTPEGFSNDASRFGNENNNLCLGPLH